MSRYIFDSYALINYLRGEPGSERVEALLKDHRNERWLSVVNLGEVYYIVERRTDMKRAEDVLIDVLSMPIQLVDVNVSLAIEAAQIKAKYALSYADCFVAALAQRLGASVVTGDEEFQPLEQHGVVSIEWLPSKPKRSSR